MSSSCPSDMRTRASFYRTAGQRTPQRVSFSSNALAGQPDFAALRPRGGAAEGRAAVPSLRGRLLPVGYSYRLEHLRMMDRQLFTEAQIVQWCGHDHRYLVMPHAAGERRAGADPK